MSIFEDILIKNRLFNYGYDDVYVNKEKEFLSNYTFNETSNNPWDYENRNKDGLIILDDKPFIINDAVTDGHNKAQFIVLTNGSRILLKEVEKDEMYMELLFKELADFLNIPCASYDIVTLNNHEYLASNSFLDIDDLLFDYYKLYEYKNQIKYSNIEINIKNLISKSNEINQTEFLLKAIFIDILTKNNDRFPNNFRAILRNNNMDICPLFDNGLCGLNRKYHAAYLTYNNRQNTYDILNYIMSYKALKDWINKLLPFIDCDTLKDNIYRKKGIYIDDKTSKIFANNVTEIQKKIL